MALDAAMGPAGGSQLARVRMLQEHSLSSEPLRKSKAVYNKVSSYNQ